MFRRWQKRYYLAFTLPAIIMGAIVATLFYTLLTDSFNQQILQQGHTESYAKTQTLREFIDHAVRSLNIVELHPALHAWLRSDFAPEETPAAQSLFKTVIDLAPEFAQLRFIDTQGNERILINRETIDSPAETVEDAKLESKGLRNYFLRSIALEEGQLWISALDLNIENGLIEQPLKPVVRISKPVIIDGVRYGILVINVFIQPLLEQLSMSSNYHVYIIDKEGEFLLHKEKRYNWSRYIPSGQNLHTVFPDEAEAILAHPEYTGKNVHSHTLDLPNDEELKLLLELKTDIAGNNHYTALAIAFISGIVLIFVLLPFVNIAIIRRSNLINKELDIKLKNQLYEHRRKDNLLLQQSKMAIMGEMLSMIAHQWRQPLTSIAAIAARLKLTSSLDALKQEELDQACDDINEISQYLSGTINDFRDFFRPKLKTEQTSVPFILDKALMMLEGLITKNGIAVNKTYASVDTIDTYANELLQVVLNLIKNAADALMENTSGEASIAVSLTQENGSVVISISDNGCGIPEEVQAHIFEPYFTTKQEMNGTGLGLYMSKVIIEDHLEGTLTFHSTPEGTAFTITLPQEVTPKEVQ